MSNQQPATTVDSLISFKYKKKFSFVNKKHVNKSNNSCSTEDSNSDSESHNDDDADNDHKENKQTDEEKKKSSWKGSARLKDDQHSSDSSGSSHSHKPPSKKKKDKKKFFKYSSIFFNHSIWPDLKNIYKIHKKYRKNHDNGEDKMNRLLKMFPEYSPSFIRNKLIESNGSAKKCIDLIMKEKEKKMNKSLEIEEWSDGDEHIRAKNLENKLKRISKESQSDEISNCLDKKRKSTLNEGTHMFSNIYIEFFN